jgi:hypothetical protein
VPSPRPAAGGHRAVPSPRPAAGGPPLKRGPSRASDHSIDLSEERLNESLSKSRVKTPAAVSPRASQRTSSDDDYNYEQTLEFLTKSWGVSKADVAAAYGR